MRPSGQSNSPQLPQSGGTPLSPLAGLSPVTGPGPGGGSEPPLSGLLQTQPRRAVNLVFQVVFKGLNVPQSFPAMQVQPGLTVTLRGVNGNRVNTADAYGAMYAEQLSEPGRYTISPDTEVAFPCDSLNQIWVMGAAGDGIQATIRGNAVG